jgi:hypothetical protein
LVGNLTTLSLEEPQALVLKPVVFSRNKRVNLPDRLNSSQLSSQKACLEVRHPLMLVAVGFLDRRHNQVPEDFLEAMQQLQRLRVQDYLEEVQHRVVDCSEDKLQLRHQSHLEVGYLVKIMPIKTLIPDYLEVNSSSNYPNKTLKEFFSVLTVTYQTASPHNKQMLKSALALPNSHSFNKA